MPLGKEPPAFSAGQLIRQEISASPALRVTLEFDPMTAPGLARTSQR